MLFHKIPDITTGVIWVALNPPREEGKIIGAHFASLPFHLLAIITICYRTYQKEGQSHVPAIGSQSILLLCFLGLLSRCPYYTGDSAKWGLSPTATSVCQAASIWIQYFLKNDALELIDKSAGAAFAQEMCLDRWGSQPVPLASRCLSTKFKHQPLRSIQMFPR